MLVVKFVNGLFDVKTLCSSKVVSLSIGSLGIRAYVFCDVSDAVDLINVADVIAFVDKKLFDTGKLSIAAIFSEGGTVANVFEVGGILVSFIIIAVVLIILGDIIVEFASNVVEVDNSFIFVLPLKISTVAVSVDEFPIIPEIDAIDALVAVAVVSVNIPRVVGDVVIFTVVQAEKVL